MGIAPNARIMVLKNSSRRDGESSTAATLKAVEYATRNKAKILNMSFGGDVESSFLFDELRIAANDGVLLVAAAGNEGKDLNKAPKYPCVWQMALCVASTDKSGLRSSFSNYSSSFNTRPLLAAPGNQIVSTLPSSGYGFMSGTSMATPHVAAALAALHGAWPREANEQLVNRLFDGADVFQAAPAYPKEGSRLNLYRSLMHPQSVVDATGMTTAARSSTINCERNVCPSPILASWTLTARRQKRLHNLLGISVGANSRRSHGPSLQACR